MEKSKYEEGMFFESNFASYVFRRDILAQEERSRREANAYHMAYVRERGRGAGR